MTLKITIEVEIDDTIYGHSEEDKIWLENEVLVGDGSLFLHSNEVGDTVGEVKKVTNIRWLFKNII